MKYILVTGATGFIGSHLIERLLKEENNLIIIKRSFSNINRISNIINQYNDNVVLFDIDKQKLSEVFNKYEIEGIFHLAASYIKDSSTENIKTMTQSNIAFPTELLDLAVRHEVKYFINTGTFFEYSLDKLPLTETSPIDSLNYYSTTKIAFEDILKFYTKKYNINSSTLKLYTPYGSRDDENKIIPYLIINTLKNQEVNINNPDNRLDIVHVNDIIDAYMNVKDKILSFDDYEVFNIAAEVNYSINEIYAVIKYIINQEDYEIDKKSLPIFNDCTKIKNILKWEPKLKIEDGIKLTVDYYKKIYE